MRGDALSAGLRNAPRAKKGRYMVYPLTGSMQLRTSSPDLVMRGKEICTKFLTGLGLVPKSVSYIGTLERFDRYAGCGQVNGWLTIEQMGG